MREPRARRAKVLEPLRGERCRWCGGRTGWPRPVGLVFADGTAAHHACDERAEAERVKLGAVTLYESRQLGPRPHQGRDRESVGHGFP